MYALWTVVSINTDHRESHITHRALALYALGSSGEPIRSFYEQDIHIQRPPIEPPEAITSANVFEHLGDEK